MNDLQKAAQVNADTKSGVTGNQVFTTRIVGIIAIAYATSLIAQNVVFGGTGAPDYSAPIDVVLTYHAERTKAL
jgi:hypothetical protein